MTSAPGYSTKLRAATKPWRDVSAADGMVTVIVSEAEMS